VVAEPISGPVLITWEVLRALIIPLITLGDILTKTRTPAVITAYLAMVVMFACQLKGWTAVLAPFAAGFTQVFIM
jgi:hypothetical protein